MASSSISWSSQYNFSRQYILAAALYTRKCAEIERAYNPGSLSEHSEEFDELHTEYKAYAISSVIFATEFFEAAINKIFSDSEDYLKTHTSGTLNYAIWQTMAQESKKLKAIKGGREILKKFDIALFSARRKGLARANSNPSLEIWTKLLSLVCQNLHQENLQ